MAETEGLNDAPYRGKRVIDLALVAAVALPAGLLAAAVGTLVKFTSPGPVLFRQERIGLDGQPFIVLKFRTMIDADNAIVTEPDRITRVGKWLRRFSIDELPQLVNVVRGDMSFVGPRPTLAYQVDRYTKHQKRRLAVRPGLTGWAQVNGRNSIKWRARIDLDVEYVERQSATFDLGIVVRTFSILLSGSGVETTDADDPVSRSEP